MHDARRRDSNSTSTPDITADNIMGMSHDDGVKMCRSLPLLDQLATEMDEFPYNSEEGQGGR